MKSNVTVKDGLEEPENGIFLTKEIHFSHKDNDKVIIVCMYKVMYGWRVRAEMVNAGEPIFGYALDICTGAVPPFMSIVYNIVLGTLVVYAKAMISGKTVGSMSNLFPEFRVKPIWKDAKFETFVINYHKYIGKDPAPTVLIDDVLVDKWNRRYLKDK